MLDIKRIREDFDGVKKAVESRGKGDFGIEDVRTYDLKRREVLATVEQMKNEQKVKSKQIPMLKKEGKDTTELMAEMKELSDKIKALDEEVSEYETKLKDALLNVPNTPYKDVQEGLDDSDNVELRKWGEPTKFDFEEKAHWDIGEGLDILDFERAAKIAGARFTVYKGLGARLERSVINFMLNLHTEEHQELTILKGSACTVEAPSLQTSIQKQNTVKSTGVVAIEFDGYEDVYNMEVEDNHNFAVNGGLVVHNCMDSMRYFVRTKHVAPTEIEMQSTFM